MGLPRDVIEVMVTQAALAARKDHPYEHPQRPVRTICKWMRDFCRAAKVQGLKCDDHWFKLALQTFGVSADATRLPCMINGTKRNAAGRDEPTYRTWQDLFGNICDALTRQPHMWDKGTWGVGDPVPDTFVDVNATQRQLDFEAEHVIHAWIREIPTSTGGGETVARDKVERLVTAWAAGEGWDTEPEKAGHLALLTLLLLRGAELMTAPKYALLDSKIYHATQGLINGSMDAAEAREQVREALEADASLFQTQVDPLMWNEAQTADPMHMAIRAGDAGILNLLLDHGWGDYENDMDRITVGRDEFVYRNPVDYNKIVNDLYFASVRNWRRQNLFFANPPSYNRDWTVDQQTTERVIRAVATPYADEQIGLYHENGADFYEESGLRVLWMGRIDVDRTRRDVDQAALQVWISATRYDEQDEIHADAAEFAGEPMW